MPGSKVHSVRGSVSEKEGSNRMLARTRLYLVALALLSLPLFGGCAHDGQKCQTAECTDDAKITAAINAQLYANKAIATWDITVQTIKHTVYLYGAVDTNVQRAFIESTARETPGVQRVVNSIVIRGRF